MIVTQLLLAFRSHLEEALAAAFCLSKGREKSKPILCHGEYMPAPRKLVKGSDTGRPTTDWDEDKAEKIFMPA